MNFSKKSYLFIFWIFCILSVGCADGNALDVVAPGENLYCLSKVNPIERESGTSFAAPQVAGLAALIFSKYPNESADDVRYRIRKTAKKISSSNYKYTYTSTHSFAKWNEEMGVVS